MSEPEMSPTLSQAQLMTGSPPDEFARVTLANWQRPPFNRWAFQHMRELIPTHRIPRGDAAAPELVRRNDGLDLRDLPVTRLGDWESSVRQVMDDTWTDAIVISHAGEVVLEEYASGMRADTVHLLMSVSKSVVGCVAGILLDRGVVDADAAAGSYIPELSQSGYADARVRDLLDMRTGVAFGEDYEDPTSEVRAIEGHMGWGQLGEDEELAGLYGYLARIGRDEAHGSRFTYRSADTDVLGWVCERAAGMRMADLVSELIWQPMGAEFDAEITCDAMGSAVHDGGICATARDLTRFGNMLLEDGRANGTSVVPGWFLQQARQLDPDTRAAFAASDAEPLMTGGWYRNQFWFLPGISGDIQLCLGIHGQMIFVDRSTATVAVKFSTWPRPQDGAYLIDTIRAFAVTGRHLAGLGMPTPGHSGVHHTGVVSGTSASTG